MEESAMWKDRLERSSNWRFVLEDQSQPCRRNRYCVLCNVAFCSHCCHRHHSGGWHVYSVLPVHVDAGGQPTFPKHYLNGVPVEDHVIPLILAQDYATTFARDAYCTRCMRAFSTAVCFHHHWECGRDSIVRRIEEHGDGRHYVRCTGDERWVPYLEDMLGDPVEGEDYGGQLMLLPLLRRTPGVCVQCGGTVPSPYWPRCSPACAASHDLEVARRRERRDARRAARGQTKLPTSIDG